MSHDYLSDADEELTGVKAERISAARPQARRRKRRQWRHGGAVGGV